MSKLSSIFSWRLINLYICLINLAVIIYLYYLEYFEGILPCTLCLAERYILIAITIIAGINCLILHYYKLTKLIGSIILLVFCSLGIIINIQHLKLLYSPISEQIPSCSVSLNQLLVNLELNKIYELLFFEAKDCGLEDFTILGLQLPWWSLLSFGILALLSVYLCLASMWVNPLTLILRTVPGTIKK